MGLIQRPEPTTAICLSVEVTNRPDLSLGVKATFSGHVPSPESYSFAIEPWLGLGLGDVAVDGTPHYKLMENELHVFLNAQVSYRDAADLAEHLFDQGWVLDSISGSSTPEEQAAKVAALREPYPPLNIRIGAPAKPG